MDGYKFVDPPEDLDRLMCPLCGALAHSPHRLLSCECRQMICKGCVRGVRVCPSCNRKAGKAAFCTEENDRILSLKVKCKNDFNGCKWSGGLSSLMEHINLCPFDTLLCPNKCLGGQVYLLRTEVHNHLERDCPSRIVRCEYCGKFGKFSQISSEHLRTCPRAATECECGETLLQGEMPVHKGVCPRAPVPCRYADVGCRVLLPRTEMQSHETDVEHHLNLALESVVSLRACGATPPITFKMDNFYDFKSHQKLWYGSGFYSHRHGYKMCLCVSAYGSESAPGNDLSLYVYLMPGVYDERLVWPFRGKVKIQLLNQLYDADHTQYTASFVSKENTAYNCRVLSGKRARCGWGEDKLMSHEGLGLNAGRDCQYLKDNTLYLRVIEVDVYDSNKSWLTSAVVQ